MAKAATKSDLLAFLRRIMPFLRHESTAYYVALILMNPDDPLPDLMESASLRKIITSAAARGIPNLDRHTVRLIHAMATGDKYNANFHRQRALKCVRLEEVLRGVPADISLTAAAIPKQ